MKKYENRKKKEIKSNVVPTYQYPNCFALEAGNGTLIFFCLLIFYYIEGRLIIDEAGVGTLSNQTFSEKCHDYLHV
jgi:hypothetical protein